jgi:hypothetical protein
MRAAGSGQAKARCGEPLRLTKAFKFSIRPPDTLPGGGVAVWPARP